jgi:hypothetical protein
VNLTVGTLRVRSATKENDLNPTWNEKFDFPITDTTSQILSIKLKDENYGKSQSLGSAQVTISRVTPPSIPSHPIHPIHPKLRKKKKKKRGAEREKTSVQQSIKPYFVFTTGPRERV